MTEHLDLERWASGRIMSRQDSLQVPLDPGCLVTQNKCLWVFLHKANPLSKFTLLFLLYCQYQIIFSPHYYKNATAQILKQEQTRQANGSAQIITVYLATNAEPTCIGTCLFRALRTSPSICKVRQGDLCLVSVASPRNHESQM